MDDEADIKIFRNGINKIKKCFRVDKPCDPPDILTLTKFTQQSRDPIDRPIQRSVEGTNQLPETSPRDDDVYDFSHPRRGIAVIINNEKFQTEKDRDGSEVDARALQVTCEELGFDVRVYVNKTAKQMMTLLWEVSRLPDHAHADCFLCAVLSHGDETWTGPTRKDMIYGTDGEGLATDQILELFNDKWCPALRDKPRLFFLQACRGDKEDDGQLMTLTQPIPTRSLGVYPRRLHVAGSGLYYDMPDRMPWVPSLGPDVSDSVPEKAGEKKCLRDLRKLAVKPPTLYKDYLVMYATPPGYLSWRRDTGSWFIQSLCRQLRSACVIDGRVPLVKTLTRVCGVVALEYKTGQSKKEMPVIYSMLVKDVYFNVKPQTKNHRNALIEYYGLVSDCLGRLNKSVLCYSFGGPKIRSKERNQSTGERRDRRILVKQRRFHMEDTAEGNLFTSCFRGDKSPDSADRTGHQSRDKPAQGPPRGANLLQDKCPYVDDVYDFTHQHRGIAVIINNVNFVKTGQPDDLDDRSPSKKDAHLLKKTLKKLGFAVKSHKNKSADEIVTLLIEVSKRKEHADADCFVCVILTHGGEARPEKNGQQPRKDVIFGTDGETVDTAVVIDIFSDDMCQALKNKPRLFFIQACRGAKKDAGQYLLLSKHPDVLLGSKATKKVEPSLDKPDTLPGNEEKVEPSRDQPDTLPGSEETKKVEPSRDQPDTLPGNEETKKVEPSRDQSHTLPDNEETKKVVSVTQPPLYKDLLVMYATPPGYLAWLRENGSWFIQILCRELTSKDVINGTVPLMKTLTRVSAGVANEYKSSEEKMKQMPVVYSMLIKDVYFTQKK
ncbi:uncharacterized protein LOC131935747 [Physella acuta]|uniref:uncharacterized protein LOC131935747 n=1 Tax=Physella acuta TaxID=109671 RepID=UPI0027DB1B30|nr:uncharacterized protein LOC131935747 [Physella acuta]